MRHILLLSDSSVYEGYRGRRDRVGAGEATFPTRLSGAAHVWAEAMVHAFRDKGGLLVVIVRRGLTAPDDRPRAGLGDLWLGRREHAALMGNAIEASGVSFPRVDGVSCGHGRSPDVGRRVGWAPHERG